MSYYIYHHLTLAMPQDVNATIDEELYVNMSWLPPKLNKRHGSLLSYVINCTGVTTGDVLSVETQNTTGGLQLDEYKVYQCCVAAVSQAGIGNPSCILITSQGRGTIV